MQLNGRIPDTGLGPHLSKTSSKLATRHERQLIHSSSARILPGCQQLVGVSEPKVLGVAIYHSLMWAAPYIRYKRETALLPTENTRIRFRAQNSTTYSTQFFTKPKLGDLI